MNTSDDGRHYEDGIYVEFFPEDTKKEKEPESIVIIRDNRIELHLHHEARELQFKWFANIYSLLQGLNGQRYDQNPAIEIMLYKMWGDQFHSPQEYHALETSKAIYYENLVNTEWSNFFPTANPPASSTWKFLEQEWGYPTVVGVHDELYRCVRLLNDLAAGIEATLPYVSKDLANVASELFNTTAEDATMVGLNQAYTMQIVTQVRSASSHLEQAAKHALDRFST